MAFQCDEDGCDFRTYSGDKLADHMTDEHDAFSKVLQGGAP